MEFAKLLVGLRSNLRHGIGYVPEPIKDPLRKQGIREVFSYSYRRALAPFVPSEERITVHGLTIRFKIANVDEYLLFQRYPETDRSFPVLGDILTHLEPDDVFWDVGANAGIYTCFAAAKLPTGRVVGVEPNPNNVDRIEENLRLNGLSADVHERALMAERDERTLKITEKAGAGEFGYLSDDASDGIRVETARGDDLVAEGVPAPDVLKIDVEGAEMGVLRGMERAISECRLVYLDVVTSDSYYGSNASANEIYGWLRNRGFEIDRLWEWDSGHFIRAERSA
ncbi:FkbM family methyltransferase [Halosolutus halophilus]|uniref:FkbM family methyltransferase n=1 Tax=Halosolutus halophilus TaxID=1552990 RepID=UPI00223517C6|nr:FkbM family methyltransferase [Halosolutus halophilus]